MELLLSNIGNAIGWTLIHFIWQGTCLFFAYWALTRLFFKNNIKAQYWIGMFFITMCLIIPIREFFIQMSSVSSSVSFTAIQQLGISIDAVSTTGILSTGDLLISLIQKFIPYLVIFWIISVSLISTHLFKSWLTLVKISQDTTIKVPEKLVKKLKEASEKLSLRFNPIITISEKISLPATFGYFKPIVLFPASLMMKLPSEQLEIILFHELCHIKRADFLHNIIQLLVETLFFYHPLTKWISKDIRKNRELCCDELVLQLNAKPLVYAKALTNIATLYNKSITNNSSHLQIAATDGELFNRIKFLMMDKKSKSPISNMFISLIIISLALVVFNSIKSNTISKVPIFTSSINSKTLIIEKNKRPQYGSPSIEKIISSNLESKKASLARTKTISTKSVPKAQLTQQTPQIIKKKEIPLLPVKKVVNKQKLDNDPTVAEKTTQNNLSNTKSIIADSNPQVEKVINNYPKLIKKVNPIYKRIARSQGIEGTVILSFNIDKNGRVKRIKVDKSSPLKILDGDARSALRKWRFDPKSINTSNVNNRYQQIFSFNLGETNTCTSGDIGSHLYKQVCSDI